MNSAAHRVARGYRLPYIPIEAVLTVNSRNIPRIGRYEVVGHLATGGMAEILLARIPGERGFARAVVVKRILPHLARRKDFEAMFLDEARVAAGIHHPNVVQVFDLGREGDELFLVMEYLEGESAAGLLRRMTLLGEKLEVRIAAYIVAEIAAGLHAAHESKDADGNPLALVHRDVSPNNVFVGYDGSVKLIDFGIAKTVDAVSRTEAGQVRGKTGYLSPEQCKGKHLDRRSDVFSLGVVLYELGTCRRLFGRPSDMLTFRAICTDPIVPPSRARPEFPTEVEAIVLTALRRERERRFQSALEMRQALHEFLRKASGPSSQESLALLMQRVFADRIEEKAELMRCVRNGSTVTTVPVAETDLGAELPMPDGVPFDVLTGDDASTSRLTVRKPRRAALWILGGVCALAAVAIVVLEATATSSKRAPVVEASGVAPSPSPSSSSPSPERSIVLSIATDPPGATVLLDGRKVGIAPQDIEVPRRAETSTLEVRLAGHTSRIEHIVPDRDQRLLFSLATSRPSPPRTVTPPTTASPKPSAPAPVDSKGYYQF